MSLWERFNNIATVDENAISYIPKNPDISLKEIIVLCKEDAMNERVAEIDAREAEVQELHEKSG